MFDSVLVWVRREIRELAWLEGYSQNNRSGEMRSMTFDHENALREFEQLNPTGKSVDQFWHQHTLGNNTQYSHSPHERFNHYVSLLSALQKADPGKYKIMRKGTPFYFMGWLALDMEQYSKGFFYMDAAVSEDIRGNAGEGLNTPAAMFFQMNQNNVYQVGSRSLDIIKKQVNSEFDRFTAYVNQYCNKTVQPITQQIFANNFVLPLLRDQKTRSIVTSLYSFLMESNDLTQGLSLRSSDLGSIEIILLNLFKGGLIFESLLKHFYKQNNGREYYLMSGPLESNRFKGHFGLTEKLSQNANKLEEIVKHLPSPQARNIQRTFEITAKIRNTSGHGLQWDDVFQTPETYQTLFEEQVSAIFLLISKNCPDGQ